LRRKFFTAGVKRVVLLTHSFNPTAVPTDDTIAPPKLIIESFFETFVDLLLFDMFNPTL